MEQTASQISSDLKYCLYVRKSSEQSERQALSIDSQIGEMEIIAERDGLTIVETRRESHSAKESGQRPVYNQMIEEVGSGKFNAILTWAPDRLSRNAGDLGGLVDLMDQGKLIEIRTPGQKFTNSPNEKFLLMILCSQAKLENDNRGVNVKRGLKVKAQMGWRPGICPLGYLNGKTGVKGDQKISPDPERAPIIKEMFERVTNHGHSGRMIYSWLKDQVKFSTRSGKAVTLSSIYLMLRNPYYCGKFEYPVKSGRWYKVAHESIISEELFDRIDIDKIGARKKLEEEISRYERFSSGVLGQATDTIKLPTVDIRSYAKYVLQNGTCEEKREVLGEMRSKLIMKNQILSLFDDKDLSHPVLEDRLMKI